MNDRSQDHDAEMSRCADATIQRLTEERDALLELAQRGPATTIVLGGQPVVVGIPHGAVRVGEGAASFLVERADVAVSVELGQDFSEAEVLQRAAPKSEPILVSFMLRNASGVYNTETAREAIKVRVLVDTPGADAIMLGPKPDPLERLWDGCGWACWSARWAPGVLVDGRYRLIASIADATFASEVFVVEQGRRR